MMCTRDISFRKIQSRYLIYGEYYIAIASSSMPKEQIDQLLGRYMLHDPQVYDDPHTFNPSRFLGPQPEPDPQQVWSVGRRVCPGRFLAEETDWLAVASILATLNVNKLTDKSGRVIEPKLEWTGYIVTYVLIIC
jgi:hypothetical protein